MVYWVAVMNECNTNIVGNFAVKISVHTVTGVR